jgi:hypothetical protein
MADFSSTSIMETQMDKKDIEKALEQFIKQINEILANEVKKEIERNKKVYEGAINILGELNASISKQ